MATSVSPSSRNLSRRYSARCCSPNGLDGTEQMRMCSSVNSSAAASKNLKASLNSGEASKFRKLFFGAVFREELIQGAELVVVYTLYLVLCTWCFVLRT